MKKSCRLTAHVTEDTKKAIIDKAKKEKTTISYIVGKILDSYILSEEIKE